MFSILLWEMDALRRFTSEVRGPPNVVRLPQAPSLGELAELGVSRVSWGLLLHADAIGPAHWQSDWRFGGCEGGAAARRSLPSNHPTEGMLP